MNIWESMTEAEKAACKAKAQETRKRNKENKLRMEKEAKEASLREAHDLKNGIADLRRQLSELQNEVELVEKIKTLTGSIVLSEKQIVSGASKVGELSGVYFLIKDDKVIYVGQSVNVFSRVSSHEVKDFTHVSWVPCEIGGLDALESLYIHTLRPDLNSKNGPDGGMWAPIPLKKLLGGNFKPKEERLIMALGADYV